MRAHRATDHMKEAIPLLQRTMKRTTTLTPDGKALRLAVDRVLKGSPADQAAVWHGLPVQAVRDAVERYHAGGWSAVEMERKRPHGPSPKRKLTVQQEQELHSALRRSTPDELGMLEPLWTKEAVHAYILQRTGMDFPARTLAAYLERWGFAPEKPMRTVYRRHPNVFRTWMRNDYPVIAMEAKEEHGQIRWWNSLPLTARERDRLYADPNATALWEKDEWQLLHCVTNRGQAHWCTVRGVPDVQFLIAFFERLRRATVGVSFLLVQDHPLFNSPTFVEWSLRNKDGLRFHFLPDAALNSGETE